MTLFRVYALVCLYAALAVFVVHKLLRDDLIFHSDLLSLFVYGGSVTLAIGAVLTFMVLPCRLLSKRLQERLYLISWLTAASLILAMLFWLGISFVENAYPDLTVIRWLFYNEAGYFRPESAAGMILVAGMLVFLRRDRKFVAQRVTRLVLLAVTTLLLAVPALAVFPRLAAGVGDTTAPPRHLVLLVLDAMPAQFLRTYNPAAARTPVDDIFSRGLVLTNMRTSTPWTYAFFGTLYGGEPTPRFSGSDNIVLRRDNLFAALQRDGIGARWITYRQLGVPEGGGAHDDRYAGLRSRFLSWRQAWLPEFLGLDYGLLFADAVRDRFGISHFLGAGDDPKNSFTDILLPQLRRIQRRHRRSLTVFHVRWTQGQFSMPERKPDPNEAKDLTEFYRQVNLPGYRYEPEFDHVAALFRRRAANSMQQLGGRLTAFFKAVATDPALGNFAFMITSDHGAMYSKGRMHYAYHPNDEVMRVPFAVINGEKKGIDSRGFSTPDLSASVLHYFDVKTELSPYAVSLFKDKAPAYAVSVTRPSDRHKEWFMVLVRDGMKYQMNLHPDGRGETKIMRKDGAGYVVVGETDGPPFSIIKFFAEALTRYNIETTDVHAKFRTALNDLLQ